MTAQNPNFAVTAQPNTVAGYQVSNIPPDPQYISYPSITTTVDDVPLVDTVPNVAHLAVIEDGLPGAPAVGGTRARATCCFPR